MFDAVTYAAAVAAAKKSAGGGGENWKKDCIIPFKAAFTSV